MTVSRSGRQGNLPADVTTFVGRAQEIARVRGLLPDCRLVTLTGLGGVGKTRLGLRVASELSRAFRDGVWFVELAGLHDGELVPATIAAALGLQSRAERMAVSGLVDFLSEREALLILDNCEHLVDACAFIVAELLRNCPGVRILATSREALGVSGEHVLSVAPLPVPGPGEAGSVRQAAEYPAVRLFVDRAAAVRPGFALTAENRASVEDICRRLDGIPLALELAAGRLRALSPKQLQQRLDDRYEVLTGGNRSALPRQQTLRALVDWSYDLCTPLEQRLWAWLSVFEGPFELEAAEAICSGGEIPADKILHVLAGLVDKSIVGTSEHEDELRYHLSETLREYAWERLPGDEREPIARRHRDYYAELVQRAEDRWFSAAQVPEFGSLRRSHANLRAALRFGLQHPDEAAAGLSMASSLRFYWLMSGLVAEGVHWLGRLLERYGKPDAVRLKAMRVQAHLSGLVSDRSAAERWAEQAQQLAKELDDLSETAYAAQTAGLVALFGDDCPRAAELLLEASALHERLSDPAGYAYDNIQAALAIGRMGESERAAQVVDAVLPTCRASGDNWTTSLALFALGIEACRAGDCVRSADLHRESIGLRVPLNDRRNIGLNFEGLAWTAVASNQMERAARLFGASLRIQQDVGTPLKGLAHLYAMHQEYEPQARAALGTDRFERLKEEGCGLSFREAVALGLGESTRESASAAPGGAGGSDSGAGFAPLTRRERQIAELVAEGLTNKEIAARLVISIRTAEGHVENVLSKLNFGSRAQVAAWVATQRAQDTDG